MMEADETRQRGSSKEDMVGYEECARHKRMNSLGINGERKINGQVATLGSPGKWELFLCMYHTCVHARK